MAGKKQRDYAALSSYLKFTEDPAEMEQIGRRIAEDFDDIYTPLMLEKLALRVQSHIPEAEPETQEQMLYRSVYDYWAYGCSVDEEFYLHFDAKSHAEKIEYLVVRLRNLYIMHLNGGGSRVLIDILGDKYRLYQRLKPHYKREMIELQSDADFSLFEAFTKRHDTFVVKPSNFWGGNGVHKATLQDYGGDVRTAFEAILGEGEAIHARHTTRNTKIVLEELIDQDESMAILHPYSTNVVRITTIRDKNGEMVMHCPRIKIGMNGDFIASAAQNGVIAEIDPKTGVIITDGFNEVGGHYTTHPNTGIRINGFQIPRWDELLALVDELNREMAEFGYVGWDLVLSKSGWCVIEGNYFADMMFQMIENRGGRREIEDLIGWKYEKDFWWHYWWDKQKQESAE